MNMPTKSIITFMVKMISQDSCTFWVTQLATPDGIWSYVSSQPMAEEAMITSSTTPVASPALTTASLRRFQDKSR
ncbi:hypothetical protein D3C78_1802700 [compost metagenome]